MAAPIRIGLIADTHGLLRSDVHRALESVIRRRQALTFLEDAED